MEASARRPPSVDVEPRLGWMLLAVTAIALLPRLAALPFTENLFGDAIIRTELAERWLRRPHWMAHFRDGPFQYGPFHLYLLAAAINVLPARETAGQWLSLALGAGSAVPLYLMTRRLFGWRAGLLAVLGLSLWGMHVQFSTTAASEALGLFLMLWVFALFARGLEEDGLAPLLASAAVLNLACATRYDAWMFIPLLAALLWRRSGWTRAAVFGVACLPFPLVWMLGNFTALGDALYPIRYIEQFHRAWVGQGIARWGRAGYRLQNLFFWSGAAVATLSPGVALLGALGMVRAWRRRPGQRWLSWCCWIPTAYFAFRSAVVMDFVPLARFTALQLVLLLPYLGEGVEWAKEVLPRRVAGAAAVLTAALALAIPLGLGIFTYRAEGKFQDSLRPISPVSTHPAAVRRAVEFIRTEVAASGEALMLDSDPHYRDLSIAFYGGLPETRMARRRWEDFGEQRALLHPTYLVRIDGGALDQALEPVDRSPEDRVVLLDGQRFEALPGFLRPVRVYRAAGRR